MPSPTEARELGANAIATIADVGDQGQVYRMVADAISEFGRVDILVNNAGMRAEKPFAEMTVEDWREVNAVNMDGPFFACQSAVPGMIDRGWGRIINVSGLNAFKGRAGWAHVCAGKMGALGLTRALSAELAPHGITVNHIVPGAFDTTRVAGQSTPAPSADIPVGQSRNAGGDSAYRRLPSVRRRGVHHRADHPRKRRRAGRLMG